MRVHICFILLDDDFAIYLGRSWADALDKLKDDPKFGHVENINWDEVESLDENDSSSETGVMIGHQVEDI